MSDTVLLVTLKSQKSHLYQWKPNGAFFWDYSGYSYSGLGITEYTEFQFPKERSAIVKTE